MDTDFLGRKFFEHPKFTHSTALQISGFETEPARRMLRRVKSKIASMLLFILVFALSRIPGMISADFGNFSAAYALMFCGGVYLSRRVAWWLPLSVMVVTDGA